MISSRDQRRIYLLPGRPDQTRNPGLQDISTMVKQDQQSRPDVPTNPDRSCTYLVPRAHRISEAYRYQHNPSCQGTVPHGALVWTSTRRSTGPGVKIKMTLGPVLLRVLAQSERCPAPPGQPGSMPTRRLAHPVCPENEICAAPIGICRHIWVALLVLFYHCRNVL